MLRNISGQYLYFDLVSVLSGFSVTGFSGAISGRKLIDGNPMALLSGNIVEVSGGMYRANLYDFDTDGLNIGYFFTASGCVPRSFSIFTVAETSGRIFPASGVNVTVPIASISGNHSVVPIATISGVVGNSGLFVTVPIATISGTTVASVAVLSGQLSGQPLTLLSGYSYTASGIFAVATATVGSGTVYLASGHGFFLSGQIIPASGMFSGQLVTPVSGVNVVVPIASISGVVANSGLTVTVPIASVSGITTAPVTVQSGQLSGHQVDLLSGRSYTASGIFATATATVGSGTVYLASGHGLFISGQIYLASGSLSGQRLDLVSGQSYTASGIFAVATATVGSGQVYLASGHGFFLSGQIIPASGMLSGQQVTPTSGQTYIASGPFVNATATVTSGAVFLASGHNLFWSGELYPQSGLRVLVYSGTLSGQPVTPLSGQFFPASGVFTVSPIASGVLSGQPITLLSGRSYTASGINATVPISAVSGVNAVVPIATISGNNAVVPISSISGVNAVAELLSGQRVNVFSGQLSGHIIDLLSGRSYTASGIFVTATATVGSGTTFLASGHNLFWSGELYPQSGLQTIPVSGTMSGQPIVPLSGLTHLASGTVRLISGTQVVAAVVSDKSGYTLTASGLDTITVEAGMNARQALAVAAAGVAGRLQGAGTSLIRIEAAGTSGTIRISGAFDSSGNRTMSVLNLP